MRFVSSFKPAPLIWVFGDLESCFSSWYREGDVFTNGDWNVSLSYRRVSFYSFFPSFSCLLFLQNNCCKKGDPFQVPRVGRLSNTQKWIVQRDTQADKTRDFVEKGHLGGEQQGKGAPEDSSAMWLTVLGFVVMRLVSGLSLADLSDSGSFPVAHTSLSQDGFQRGGF